MQKALEGNSKITILATISQNICCYDESFNTISFATRAKKIVQVVPRNKAPTLIDPIIKQAYEARILELEKKIKIMESNSNRNSQQNISIQGVSSEPTLNLPSFNTKPNISIETELDENSELRAKLENLAKELAKIKQEKEKLEQEVKTISQNSASRHSDLSPELEQKLGTKICASPEEFKIDENLTKSDNEEIREFSKQDYNDKISEFEAGILVFSLYFIKF